MPSQFPSVISLSSLNGANGFKLDGVPGDYIDSSVSAAGDFNGDGIADILIGADEANSGAGKTYVVFGNNRTAWTTPISLSTLDGTNGLKLDGVWDSYSYSGYSVSAAGDVNGDKIADILIGAPYANCDAGATYLVFGQSTAWESSISLSTLDGSNGFILNDGATGSYSGYSVSTAGDFNHDGIADILIGAPGIGAGLPGKVYVVFGKSTGWGSSLSLSTLNGADGFTLNGVTGDGSGYSVSTAGDFNHDGIADILIGAPGTGAGLPGKVYVVFGKSTGWGSSISLSTLNGINGFKLDGVTGDDYTGYSVSAAGDVNGDRIADILIGAPYADSFTGKTYVVFGKSTAWQNSLSLSTLNGADGFRLDGVTVSDYSGYSVSTAGDVNHDGIADILIGAPGMGGSSGKAYVVFGKSTLWQSSISLSTLNGADGFKIDGVPVTPCDRYNGQISVSAAGDVNGDGGADILIGALGADVNSGAGASYVIFGISSLAQTVVPTTGYPTQLPTLAPTFVPTTLMPTLKPTAAPTLKPTSKPTAAPTLKPTSKPTHTPTLKPTKPTKPTKVHVGRRLLTSGEDLQSIADKPQTSSATKASTPLFDLLKRPLAQLSDYATSSFESTLGFFGKKLEKALLNSPAYFPNIESKTVNDWQPGSPSVLHQFKSNHTAGTLLSISGTQQNSLNASFLKIGF